MKYYNSNKTVILLINLFSMIISFTIAFFIIFKTLIKSVGNVSFFIIAYVLLFFAFHKTFIISRIVAGLFFIDNVVFEGIGCLMYRDYYTKKIYQNTVRSKLLQETNKETANCETGNNSAFVRQVYICGAKSVGQYGGFETFVMNLLQQHKDNKWIKYHIACKANGQGYMDVDSLSGANKINENEFTYCNAHGFLIRIPEWIGSAQAIYYDIKALQWICDHIEINHIEEPIVYILASRIGPFEKRYVQRIHNAGGLVYQNPDGHEDWRRKWSPLVRKYWKYSEKYAVKYANLVVCDSKNIESYIQKEYAQYQPKTTFIAYGSDITPSTLEDDDPKYVNWLTDHSLRNGEFYISVGRFVPENNFDIMIREFMKSNTKKSFAIITTENTKYAEELQQKYHFKSDKRINFVGTVYDADLLKKIRENAYGYFHGHEVGGTNPSLLESLGSTKLNMLLDVGFNREVAEDAALYWSKDEGSLASLINQSDKMGQEEIENIADKAKQRIIREYNWEHICEQYEKVFHR